MLLRELTDPNDVRKAIEEFNALGRAKFLKKYGFDKSHRERGYFLLDGESHYDCKAIFGAAYGYQHPKKGPLRKQNLQSHGEATVAKRLEEIGFNIAPAKSRQREMWAFCANPKIYGILCAIKLHEFGFWKIGQNDIRAGDYVAFWQTLDKEGRRGIVGLGEVSGGPEYREDDDPDDPCWVDLKKAFEASYQVPVRYVKAIEPPLWVENSQNRDFLESLSVAKARGGTIFRIKPEEFEEIIRLSGGWNPPQLEELEAIENLWYRSSKVRGQGFGLNAAERRAVEVRAMYLAKAYLSDHWGIVKDVSATSSFDLLCRTEDRELRVEVKGTIGDARTVILTKNEVREAELSGYALFVVSQIILDRDAPGGPSAKGGLCWIFHPWDINMHNPEPLAYTCELEWSLARKIETI